MCFPLLLLAQGPAERVVLEAEQAREAGVGTLRTIVAGTDATTQRLAARAIGRLENSAHQDAVAPLLRSTDAEVRLAAAAALAQMRAPFAYGVLLQGEREPALRAVILEAMGRAKPPVADAEAVLAGALSSDPAGAARGLESLFRLNAGRRPATQTLSALHAAFAASSAEEVRELILLIMNAAGDKDAATYELALTDESAQVRRLAVVGTGRWMNDKSPLVRYEAVRAAKSCERAMAAVADPSDHVALGAIDLLGTLKCDAAVIAPLVAGGRQWRIRAHALVSLARVDAMQGQASLKAMMGDPVWQVRAYAAKAAKLLKADEALAKLAQDSNPNVAIAALTTTADAWRALRSSHSGLVLAGAERLKGEAELKPHVAELTQAFARLTAEGSMTSRDPRVALLTRIGEAGGGEDALKQALSDKDPAVAAVAARFLQTAAVTVKLPVPPLPAAAYIRGLAGATARITMRGLGTMTVELLTEEAPVTAGVFAQLAEAGKYNGLTFHRIVSNFVIQGGSPGADEYDGRSREFLRDEVGQARNARGTIGISTRGRDTGDAQIYFNLADNVRLDHDYTVMAKMREGFDVMDRVQEGDVIERIEIVRRR